MSHGLKSFYKAENDVFLYFAVVRTSLFQCWTLNIFFFNLTCIFHVVSSVSDDHFCYVWIHSSIILSSPCLISVFSTLWSQVLWKHLAYPHETALVSSIFLSACFGTQVPVVQAWLFLPDFLKIEVCKMLSGVFLKRLFHVSRPWGYSSPAWPCPALRLSHLSQGSGPYLSPPASAPLAP